MVNLCNSSLTYCSDETQGEEENDAEEEVYIQLLLQFAALVSRPVIVEHGLGFMALEVGSEGVNTVTNRGNLLLYLKTATTVGTEVMSYNLSGKVWGGYYDIKRSLHFVCLYMFGMSLVTLD